MGVYRKDRRGFVGIREKFDQKRNASMALDSRNRFDYKDSLELGTSAQEKFKALAIHRGWRVTAAAREQDIHEHWDFLITKDNGQYRVDVKARKRLSRQDDNVQEDWIWLEFHSVRPDDQGWLFGGKADLFAFEKADKFVIITRDGLQEIANTFVAKTERVSSPQEAKYKLYSRQGRADLLSMIEMKLVESRAWDVWEKNDS
jgi:hypothetical protein